MKFQMESKMIVHTNVNTETRDADCFLQDSKHPGLHDGTMTQLAEKKQFLFLISALAVQKLTL